MFELDVVLLGARLVLTAVFGLAGAAKLLDLPGSRRTLAEFGVPGPLVGPTSIALPVAELAVALALLDPGSAWYAATAALALLLLFIGGIAANLMRGRQPECHCFGQVHSEPAGPATLVRNLVFALLASSVVAAGSVDAGPGIHDWLGPMTPFDRLMAVAGVAVVAILVVQSSLLLRLTRQNTTLLARIDSLAAGSSATAPAAADTAAPAAPGGLPTGAPAPDFALTTLEGHTATLESLLAGKDLMLVFSDPACGPCTRLLPDIARWQRDHADVLTLAVVSRGAPDENRLKSEEYGVRHVLLQRDREVAEAYKVLGTPSSVLIRPNRTVGSALAQGEIEIARFMASLTNTLPPGIAPGDPAPEFTLSDLDGDAVTMDRFRGTPALLLFWNPGCGHCQQMLNDLRAWESAPPRGAPRLLIVSAGTSEANREQQLRSVIVLDDKFTLGTRFGSPGTPSAVLIDADGRVASPLVTGAPAIFELASRTETGDGDAPVSLALPDVETSPVSAPVLTLSASDRPRRKSCVQDELLADGGIVLYDSCHRQMMTLNATAALIWDYCDGDNSVEAIIDGVRDVFPSEAAAGHDVRELLDRLLQSRMIEVPAEGDAAASSASASASAATVQ